MPAAIAIPLITAGVTGGTAIAGGVMQSKAAKKGQTVQQQAADAALAFEKEQDRLDRERYDKEYARKTQIEDEDRTYSRQRDAEKDARLAPYRAFGQQGLETLSGLLTPRGPIFPRQNIPNTVPSSGSLAGLVATNAVPRIDQAGPPEPVPPNSPPPAHLAAPLAQLLKRKDVRYAR